jgi:ribosomal protein S18 acetylase RimI-like enzyme
MNTLSPILEFRPAEPADQASLVALLTDTYRVTWLPQLRTEVAERFERERRLEHYVAECHEQFWLAVQEQRIVGMVHWRGDFLEALHVLRACQGLGIGGALLELAEARMRDAGIAVSRLETDTFNRQSRGFYRKHGYEEVGEYPDAEWDSGFTTVLMRKRLSVEGL